MGCHVDERFAREIDAARGGKSRSEFLREAIHSYMCCKGRELPESFKYAPDRAGKGGRPRKQPVEPTVMMNEDTKPDPIPEQKPVKYPKGKGKK